MPPVNKKLLLASGFALRVSNAADEPAEISIRGYIGDSFDYESWTSSNTEEEVINALAVVPRGTPINLRINSEGGNLAYALGIYNALQRRAADVTTFNDGIACSSAAVLMMAGSRAVMPKSSVFMLHCASNCASGNAVEMRKNAELLDAFDKSIAAIFAAKTKKTPEQIMDLLKAETWMTGDEARQNGFADEDTDTEPAFNDLDPGVTASWKRPHKSLEPRLLAVRNSANRPPTQPNPEMKRIVTALVAAGLLASAEATEDQVLTVVTNLKSERDTAAEENKKHRDAQKTRVTNRVKAAITAKQIKPEREASLIAMGIQDETNLDFLADIAAPTAVAPKTPRGAAPAPVEGEQQDVADEIQTLRESLRTEKDPTVIAATSRKLRDLRGHKNLFAAEKN